MIKKIISFVCCLLPVGAGAVVVNPESGSAVSTEQSAWQDAVAANDSIVISGAGVNGITTQNGFAVNNMFVGDAVAQGGELNLYVLDTVANPFSVVVDTSVSNTPAVSLGALLQVLNDKTLGFKATDAVPGAKFNFLVQDIKIGNATAGASLVVEDAADFDVSGSIISYGSLDVDAGLVNVGAINAYGANTNINASQNVNMGGMVASDSSVTNIVAAGNVVSDGTVQNIGSNMTITSQADVNVDGNLENTASAAGVAANLTVQASNLEVSGTMKNDSQSGVVNLTVANWNVDGGTVDGYSVVNNGDLYATVSGNTYLKYGINLNGMGTDNVFSLDTGTLEFGADANSDTWFSAFSNKLQNFNLAIRGGDLNLASGGVGILNGADSNSDANMSVLAQNINVATVRNEGAILTLTGDDGANGGAVNVTGQVVGATGSRTNIVSAGSVTVGGALSNSGTMIVNANDVNVSDVSNSGVGSNLEITSLTETSGNVTVDGNITNANGTTTIWAKDISVAGAITNSSGVTNVRGSDTNGGGVEIGSVVAAGGVVNLNALAGSLDVQNTLTVAGGALNLGSSLYNLSVGGSAQIAGDVTASSVAASGAGDMNIAAAGTQPFVMTANALLIDGNLSVEDNAVARNVKFDAPVVNVNGNATVANLGQLTLGTEGTSYVNVGGTLSASNGGVFESWANDVVAGEIFADGKFIMHGAHLTADTGSVFIDGNVYFDEANDPVAPVAGLIVRDTDSLTVTASADGADVDVGAVSVGSDNLLTLKAADEVIVDGALNANGDIVMDAQTNAKINGTAVVVGSLNVSGADVLTADVTNTGDIEINALTGDINMAGVSTSGNMTLVAADDVVVGAVSQTGGVLDVDADSLSAQSLVVNGAAGTQANLNASSVDVVGNTNVAGDFVQGGDDGMLNLNADVFASGNLTIGGRMLLNSGDTTYNIGTNLNVASGVDAASGVTAVLNVGNSATIVGLTNAGRLTIDAARGMDLGAVVNDAGMLNLDSGNGVIEMSSLTMNGGNLQVDGAGLFVDSAFDIDAVLYQNYTGAMSSGDVNVLADNYEMTVEGLNVNSINQKGKLVINTSDIVVNGDVVATDLRFVAPENSEGKTVWQNVNVAGDVSNGVDFIGLEKMTIGGDYTFGKQSSLYAAVLPYATGTSLDTTDVNYWSQISLNPDDTLGQITNATDGQAMIQVGGVFTSGVAYDAGSDAPNNAGAVLGNSQIGISLFDVVDQGTAIWLLHADGGVENFSQLEQLRNLDVRFCNADGSLCYNYLESLDSNNGAGEDLPVYVSVRDSDADGFSDSLYVVFDPRFGGPVLLENMKIQPIVGREPDATDGEYVAAGALDDLLAGQAYNKQFFNGTPIEVIPLIFQGTNMSEMANELYDRMEYYVETSQGEGLARFSRLFQVRELEQIAGTLALNEHTAFRTFEDRIYDEFIWHRNRNLNKFWMDVDYGMLYQNIDDGKHTDGHRFAVSAGFDWQHSNTLMFGVTGRVSRTTSAAHDAMNLGYKPGETIDGQVNIDVADTDIGLGGYMFKTLGEKMRLYGNAFMDIHVFDVERNQNFVSAIEGDGLAFSLISEWGLMHDILNQYVVGNVYARAGYNFGFDVKEKVEGDDYMRLKSDGYFILTPGYSLTAQKRIYPSSWFQMRPYMSIGVEYDVFGAPEHAEYKFAPADRYTEYDVEINPLWANIGGGIEFISANGLQFGADYRYQYNSDIQLHNIRLSGSYRF